jgi:hypothetical protein
MFLELFEGSTAGDVAGFSPKMGMKKDCPCKRDPDSEECRKHKKQHKKQKNIIESPVGQVGRTGVMDAETYINNTPELRSEFRKIVKKLGGVTVAFNLLQTMNKKIEESRPTEITKLVSEIGKNKNVDIIDYHPTFDGFAALIRYKGNAYEAKIIPAEKSKEFLDKTTKKDKK